METNTNIFKLSENVAKRSYSNIGFKNGKNKVNSMHENVPGSEVENRLEIEIAWKHSTENCT